METLSLHLNTEAVSETNHLNRGILYYENNKLDSAIYYLKIISNSNDNYIKASAYYYLAEIHNKQNCFEEANRLLHEYIDITESIIDINGAVKIQKIIHENNIEREKLQNANRRNILIFSFLFLIVVLIISAFTFFIYFKRKKERKEFLQESKLKEVETQLEILNLQNQNYKNKLSQALSEKEKDEEKIKELDFLIEKTKNSYDNIIRNLDKYSFDSFRKTKSYGLIKELLEKKEKFESNFNNKEKEIILRDIENSSIALINILKNACPTLKEEYISLCCLIRIGVPYNKAHLFYNIGDASIRKRKSEIKKIMNGNHSNLFLSIFGD